MGNVLTETVLGSSAGALKTTYTYDSGNRVTKQSQNNGDIYTTYTYDKVGNIITEYNNRLFANHTS